MYLQINAMFPIFYISYITIGDFLAGYGYRLQCIFKGNPYIYI